jgi:hypothetical protein
MESVRSHDGHLSVDTISDAVFVWGFGQPIDYFVNNGLCPARS